MSYNSIERPDEKVGEEDPKTWPRSYRTLVFAASVLFCFSSLLFRSTNFSSSLLTELVNAMKRPLVPEERVALEELYDATGGEHWSSRAGWDRINDDPPTSDPCLDEWTGVTCSLFGHVIGLSLDGNNLEGALPPSVGWLASLKELHLSENPELAGTLPASLGQLINLRELHLRGNAFTGSIPEAWRDLSLLRVVDLRENKLSGAFPGDLGGVPGPPNMTSLVEMRLSGNNMTGHLPCPGFAGFAKKHGGMLTVVDFQGAPGMGEGNDLLEGPLPPLLESWELENPDLGSGRLQDWFSYEFEPFCANITATAAAAEEAAAQAAEAERIERLEREAAAAAVMAGGSWNTG